MAPERAWSARYRLTIIGALVVVLALTGGASRYDEPQQIVARLAAILAIVASLVPLEPVPLHDHRRRLGWTIAAYALLVAQLIPLPPSIWASLPGHAPYARIAADAGSLGWRPLSMTPDLTRNALFALLPPSAAALTLLYLRLEDRARVIGWLVVIGLASALLGLAQLAAADSAVLQFYHVSSPDSATGVFANRNHNAYFLSALLPLVGALARQRRETRNRVVVPVAAAIALLLTVGLAATGSRMGLVTGALGLVAGLGMFLSGARANRRPARAAVAFGLAALVASAGLVGLTIWRAGVLARYVATDLSTESRLSALKPMAATATAYLPFGAGFGSFDSIYRRFEPLDLLSTTYLNQAHNEPMQLAIEGGVPALLLLALFLWWWGSAVRNAIVQSRPIAQASAAATALLLLASLVDYPLRTPLIATFFVLCCMLLMMPEKRQRASR